MHIIDGQKESKVAQNLAKSLPPEPGAPKGVWHYLPVTDIKENPRTGVTHARVYIDFSIDLSKYDLFSIRGVEEAHAETIKRQAEFSVNVGDCQKTSSLLTQHARLLRDNEVTKLREFEGKLNEVIKENSELKSENARLKALIEQAEVE